MDGAYHHIYLHSVTVTQVPLSGAATLIGLGPSLFGLAAAKMIETGHIVEMLCGMGGLGGPDPFAQAGRRRVWRADDVGAAQDLVAGVFGGAGRRLPTGNE